ncbi:MAG: Flp family type IVb pilin [Bdellovibrionales bacterium]|nr:Flp family type IVb pilin [Bdellovibrionales bacterium]
MRKRTLEKQSGATMIEYVVIGASLSLALILSNTVSDVGQKSAGTFCQIGGPSAFDIAPEDGAFIGNPTEITDNDAGGLKACVDHFAGNGSYTPECDLNCDGSLTSQDMASFIHQILENDQPLGETYFQQFSNYLSADQWIEAGFNPNESESNKTLFCEYYPQNSHVECPKG